MNLCLELHNLFNSLPRFSFPFDESKIPDNGIYILFQKGEFSHNLERIVRIGTHTGEKQLLSRLKQHFLRENKDRSIFRKNIGRALLNKYQDSFLEKWEVDLTTKASKSKFLNFINMEKQKKIEKQVSDFIRTNFSFAIMEINDKFKRLEIESKIISTLSLCDECKPSNSWLGLFSPKEKIRESGLWLVNELYKNPIDESDLAEIKESLKLS